MQSVAQLAFQAGRSRFESGRRHSRGVAKSGIAPGLGPGDRWFESSHLDSRAVAQLEARLAGGQEVVGSIPISSIRGVAQSGRAPGPEPGGRWFEPSHFDSRREATCGMCACLINRRELVRFQPRRLSVRAAEVQLVERLVASQEEAGSNPVGRLPLVCEAEVVEARACGAR